MTKRAISSAFHLEEQSIFCKNRPETNFVFSIIERKRNMICIYRSLKSIDHILQLYCQAHFFEFYFLGFVYFKIECSCSSN